MKGRLSRRQFLKGIPIGLAGALVVGLVSRRFLPFGSRRRSQPPVFPKGSIFTPAKDRRRL